MRGVVGNVAVTEVSVMRVYFLVFSLLIQLVVAVDGSRASATPVVFVSILPQKYFVQQISGDAVRVEVMVQPGASPATYEPKPSQMKKLDGTLVYFAIGVAFERSWLDRIQGVNPSMEVVHTDRGIEKLRMKEHIHGEGHVNEPEHAEHGPEAGFDPHIWLSPSLVKQQVAVIAETLSRLLPDKAQMFEHNLSSFLHEIDSLDGQLRAALKEKTGRSFMVFHPSWGYFAREYGLDQIAVEIEGKNPKPAQLKELIEIARAGNIKVIFVQPQFSRKSAQLIAGEIGGNVFNLDPLAENWSENMKVVSEQLKNSMK